MLERILFGLLALALMFAVTVLYLGLFQPLLDWYHSRETQTALTAYWLVQGGPIFAYETPVVGFPWSIPYEFPIYQIIVAILSSAGIPLDPAGRIVSFAFFLGCLWPLRVLLRALQFPPVTFPCVAIIFVLSPIYLYWGRAFMIETCALFFCFTWFAYLARYLNGPRPVSAVIAAVAGTLGILAKSTTFPAFGMLGGILLLKQFFAPQKAGLATGRLRIIVSAAAVIAIPFIIGIIWTAYSDMVKLENEIGRHLTSRALALFNFGTLDQRVGLTLWRDVIWQRSLSDAFGYGPAPALALIAATLLRREYAYAAGATILGFLTPFLVFTNLHFNHTYYQTANAIFIIAAAGLGLSHLMSIRYGRVIAFAFLAWIVSAQLLYFRSTYLHSVTGDATGDSEYRISKVVRQTTEPNTSLIVLGADWDSTIPYYAERKSMVIPYWMPPTFFQQVFATPQTFLDGVPLGGIVYCVDARSSLEHKALVDAFIAGRAIVGRAGECTLLAPKKS